MLVGRDVEHVGVVPEDRLGAVAVVDVPVDDQDPFTDGGARSGGDGHVVDEAEPHGAIFGGVVSRWSHGNEGNPVSAPFQLGERHQSRSRGAASGRPRVGAGVGVGVDVPAAAGAERLELGQVGRRVHPGQLVERCLADRRVHQLVLQPEGAHSVHDCGQPRLLLGVVRTSVVLGDPGGPGHDQRRHAVAPAENSRVAARTARADKTACADKEEEETVGERAGMGVSSFVSMLDVHPHAVRGVHVGSKARLAVLPVTSSTIASYADADAGAHEGLGRRPARPRRRSPAGPGRQGGPGAGAAPSAGPRPRLRGVPDRSPPGGGGPRTAASVGDPGARGRGHRRAAGAWVHALARR